MKFTKIGVGKRFLSAVYIDIHKKLVNSTPFLDDEKDMKVGLKVQFLSARYNILSRHS